MSIPTLGDVRALNGRIFAMLSAPELAVLDFYRTQGRKFDVSVTIANGADAAELASAPSRQAADEILRRSNSVIAVAIGPGAEAAWAERAE